MDDFIKIAKRNKIFSINDDRITYYLKNQKDYLYSESTPEEEVRAKTLVTLVQYYHYELQYIDFEVPAQQGGGDKFADIVIYYPNGDAFMVIELKAENTKDSKDKIRKQARSYAKAEEINAKYYAYIIGSQNIVIYRTSKDTKIDKLPINYNNEIIYTYFEDIDNIDKKSKYQPLASSTSHELKQIFNFCHDEIWNGGERNAQDAFDEFSKLLFLKMYDEIENITDAKAYFFQKHEVQTEEALQKVIVENYNKAIEKKKVNSEKVILTALTLNKHQIAFIVKLLQGISLIETDNDPKGLAFETFIEHYMKGEFGQFFTPRNIVDFMLKISPINLDPKFNHKSIVLDPCCGSGSFLVHSIMNYRKKTNDSRIRNGMFKWQYFANNSIYGIELNDKISVTAKINFALHDDGHDNIQCSNGLNTDFKFKSLKEQTDLILTNPPFGTAIKSKDYKDDEVKEYYELDQELKDFKNFKNFELTQKVFDKIDLFRGKVKLGKLQNAIASEMLFFELYYRVLKEGGIAEVVIPDGVLTNSTSQFFRDYLMEHFQIIAVISLPQFTFSHYGAGVKSSVVMLRKLPKSTTIKIKEKKKEYLEEVLDDNLESLEAIEAEKKALNKKYSKEQKEEKKIESDALNEKLKDLKEDIYEKVNNKFKKNKKFQYPIFMAIAEHIGFDATGRETEKNDLPYIIEEFREFYDGL